jgi:hypothetical protein
VPHLRQGHVLEALELGALRRGQLYVACAGRHIDDQAIEFVPGDFAQQLGMTIGPRQTTGASSSMRRPVCKCRAAATRSHPGRSSRTARADPRLSLCFRADESCGRDQPHALYDICFGGSATDAKTSPSPRLKSNGRQRPRAAHCETSTPKSPDSALGELGQLSRWRRLGGSIIVRTGALQFIGLLLDTAARRRCRLSISL